MYLSVIIVIQILSDTRQQMLPFLLLVESQLELRLELESTFHLLVNYNCNLDTSFPSPCQSQLKLRLELESTREYLTSISLLNHSQNLGSIFHVLVNHSWNLDLHGSILLPSPCQLQLQSSYYLISDSRYFLSFFLLNHSWNPDQNQNLPSMYLSTTIVIQILSLILLV